MASNTVSGANINDVKMATANDNNKQKVVRDSLAEVDKKGNFVRTAMVYRNIISPSSEKFQAEAGRYHLYVSYACPWAHRTLCVLKLKGLDDCIGVTVVHPTWQKTKPNDPDDNGKGWMFANANEALTPTSGYGSVSVPDIHPDPLRGFKFVRDIYEASNDTNGKYSVPVLWDKKNNCIVNNESSDIICMLNKEFNEFAKHPQVNLNPAELQDAQKEVDEWVYPNINDGVYRCGFAQSQEAYNDAVTNLFNALDKAEDILSKQRYITGDQLTLSDIRLWVTLFRFDEVYVVYFKTNMKRICDYPNVLNFVRELYQMEGIKEVSNMDHVKKHYYTSHPVLNHFSVIPAGPDVLSDLARPHDRDRFSKN